MKRALLFIAWAFLLVLPGCGPRPKTLTVSVPKIGAADCILIRLDRQAALIDAGEEDDGQELMENLALLSITHLDPIIITHFDKESRGQHGFHRRRGGGRRAVPA